jgi:nicotinamidase/pyrazinamidase
MKGRAALLIVDVQIDFCPGGALQIPDGDRVIEPVNRAAQQFVAMGLPVLASRDWHPPITTHFSSFGGIWPVHCVQGTMGAAFHPDLHLPAGTIILSKGTDPDLHGYSAFEGVTAGGENLASVLGELQVAVIAICGLATDYCVLSTAREALKRGYGVIILTDAVAGVDRTPGDSARALEELQAAGAELGTVATMLELFQSEHPET